MLNRALDEATVAAIDPRSVSRRKLRIAMKQSPSPRKPKAAATRTAPAAEFPHSSKAARAVIHAQEIDPAPALNHSGARPAA